MSNSNWKDKLKKPSKRTLIYSKKLDKWLAESDEDIALLEMLHDKKQLIMQKIKEADPTLDAEQLASLTDEMFHDKEAALKLLKDGEDEPEAKTE